MKKIQISISDDMYKRLRDIAKIKDIKLFDDFLSDYLIGRLEHITKKYDDSNKRKICRTSKVLIK